MRILPLIIFFFYLSQPGFSQDIVEDPLDTLTRSVNVLQQQMEANKRLTVSGYIQAQFQSSQTAGIASFEGGNFASGVDKRFSIRRGRIKLNYIGPYNDKGFSVNNYMIQFDLTERGIRLMDAYAKYTDPWLGTFSLTVGLQNRPFGYEVPLSSNLRETPERGRMSQLLFPNERDLGAMITIQAPKISRWHWIKWEAGIFNGHSTPNVGNDVSDYDKKKDFISHLSFSRSNLDETFKYGGGVSYYNGGFRIDSVDVYDMSVFNGTNTPLFILQSTKVQNYNGGNITSRDFTHREYFGADLQLAYDWKPGLTQIRAEYIQGHQPGIRTDDSPSTDSRSPIANTPNTKDIYNRPFNGAYLYFIQNILQTQFQVVVKYDWFDPNTKVSGSKLGEGSSTSSLKITSASDLRYDTWGFGAIYHIDAGIKLMLYYSIPRNETSPSLAKYQSDLKDNVLTVRLQSLF